MAEKADEERVYHKDDGTVVVVSDIKDANGQATGKATISVYKKPTKPQGDGGGVSWPKLDPRLFLGNTFH